MLRYTICEILIKIHTWYWVKYNSSCTILIINYSLIFTFESHIYYELQNYLCHLLCEGHVSLIKEPLILVHTISIKLYSLFPLVISVFGTRNIFSCFLYYFPHFFPLLLLLPRISSFFFLLLISFFHPSTFFYQMSFMFNDLPQEPEPFEMVSDYSRPCIYIVNVHLLSVRFSLNPCI